MAMPIIYCFIINGLERPKNQGYSFLMVLVLICQPRANFPAQMHSIKYGLTTLAEESL